MKWAATLLLLASPALGQSLSGVSWNAPAGGPLAITVNLARTPTTTIVEPAVLIFEAWSQATYYGGDIPATGASDAEVDMECSWDFGDSGQGNWTTGTTLGDRNVYYGAPHAAHVFRSAGTYTISATCLYNGATANDSVQVTVTANSSAYPDADLVCISTSGTFDGLCATAGSKLTQSNVTTSNLTDGKRTCLRGGETFTATTIVAPTSSAGDPAWIGGCSGFGTGQPTISSGASQVFTITGAVGTHFVDFVIDGDAQAGDFAFRTGEDNDLEDVTIVNVDLVDIHKPILAHAGNFTDQLHQGLYIADSDWTGPASVTGTAAAPCSFITAEHWVLIGTKLGPCGQSGQGEFTLRSAMADQSVIVHNDFKRALDAKTVVTLRRCNHALGCGGTGVDSYPGTNGSDHWVFGYNSMDGGAMNGAIFHSGPQDNLHYETASTAWVEGNFAYRTAVPTGASSRTAYKIEHADTVMVRWNVADQRNSDTGQDQYAFQATANTTVSTPDAQNLRLIQNAGYQPEDCGQIGDTCHLLEGTLGSRWSLAVGNAYYCNPTPGTCTMFESSPTTIADNLVRLTTDGDGQLFESAAPATTGNIFPDYRIQTGDPARNTVSPLESVLEPDGTKRTDPSDPGPVDRDT